MRICKRCNIEKEDKEFYKTGSYCKCCQKEHKKQHYLDNKEKLFSISFSNFTNRTKEEIFNEIKKCIVLCSNCHRIEHYNLRKNKSSEVNVL